jgi:hypothetical protein
MLVLDKEYVPVSLSAVYECCNLFLILTGVSQNWSNLGGYGQERSRVEDL